MIHNMSLLSFPNADELTQRVCRVVDRTFGVGKNADEVGFWMSVSLAFPEPECLKLLVQALEKEFKHPFPHVQKEGGRYTQLRSLLPLIRRDIREQTKKENKKMHCVNQEDVEFIVQKTLKDFDYRPGIKELSPHDRIAQDLGMDSLDMVEIPLRLEEELAVNGITEAFEKHPPYYVKDVTRTACEILGIHYQEPVRLVKRDSLFWFMDKKEQTRE